MAAHSSSAALRWLLNAEQRNSAGLRARGTRLREGDTGKGRAEMRIRRPRHGCGVRPQRWPNCASSSPPLACRAATAAATFASTGARHKSAATLG
jgi:hypothetical protein